VEVALDQDSKFNPRPIKHRVVLIKAIVVLVQKTITVVSVKVLRCKRSKNKTMKSPYKIWVGKCQKKIKFLRIKILILPLELAIV
jgi:hypothetical protein